MSKYLTFSYCAFQQNWTPFSLEWKKKPHKHCKMFASSVNKLENHYVCAHLSEELRCIWTLTLIMLRVHERTGGSRTCAHWSLQRESCWFWLSLYEKEEEEKTTKQERYDKYFLTKSSWPLFFTHGAQVSSGTNTYDQVMSIQNDF